MTNNKKPIVKKDDIDKSLELPSELKEIIKKSEKERFFFPEANEVIKDIDVFYFLDEKSHENISSISSKFLASSFTLNYLKTVNEFLEKKYKMPQLTLNDFIDYDKVNLMDEKIAKIDNEPIINWLKEECLEELKDSIDNLDIDNIDKLIELGHIVDLSEKELFNRHKDDLIEIYDIIYRYFHRINNLELGDKKHGFVYQIAEMKKTSKEETIEIRLEHRGDRKSTKEFGKFFIQVGKEILER